MAVAKTLVSTTEGQVPLLLMNATDSDVHLYPGTSIALCQAIEEVLDEIGPLESCNQIQCKSDSGLQEPPSSVPEHLRPMLEIASKNLTPDQKEQVVSLINEWRSSPMKKAI